MQATDSSNKPSILKNTREAKGMTLEIVHEATKIPMDALKAIEEGYSSRILSPFYYRGFIKIYAAFLGLDVAEVYKQYELNQPVKVTQVLTPPLKSNRKEAKPNLFLEQAQDWLASILNPKNLKIAAKVIGLVLALFLIFKFFGFVTSLLHHKVSVIKKHTAVWQQQPQLKADHAINEEAAIVPEAKHEVVSAQSQNNQVEVAVRAPRDIWLRVKADDKVVYEATLSKGSLETWTANDRIELSGRDLERLDLEINGKHIGNLGGSDRRIRRVVITQEGLTVKK